MHGENRSKHEEEHQQQFGREGARTRLAILLSPAGPEDSVEQGHGSPLKRSAVVADQVSRPEIPIRRPSWPATAWTVD
jgi:hypothetical protein